MIMLIYVFGRKPAPVVIKEAVPMTDNLHYDGSDVDPDAYYAIGGDATRPA